MLVAAIAIVALLALASGPASASSVLGTDTSSTTSCKTTGGSPSNFLGASLLRRVTLQVTTTQAILTFLPTGTWGTTSSVGGLYQWGMVVNRAAHPTMDSQVGAVATFGGPGDADPGWNADVNGFSTSTEFHGKVLATPSRVEITFPISTWVRSGVTNPFTWSAYTSFGNEDVSRDFTQTCASIKYVGTRAGSNSTTTAATSTTVPTAGASSTAFASNVPAGLRRAILKAQPNLLQTDTYVTIVAKPMYPTWFNVCTESTGPSYPGAANGYARDADGKWTFTGFSDTWQRPYPDGLTQSIVSGLGECPNG
jgi:hypothetical protein